MTPYEIAKGEVGVKEIQGDEHNDEVLKYFNRIDHQWVDNDELAWCAAFVGYCLETGGVTSTKKLNARSYLNFGIETDNPQEGDVVVLTRGTNPAFGHVGFLVRMNEEYVYLLGGNQANQVKISAYKRHRLLSVRDYDRKKTKEEV